MTRESTENFNRFQNLRTRNKVGSVAVALALAFGSGYAVRGLSSSKPKELPKQAQRSPLWQRDALKIQNSLNTGQAARIGIFVNDACARFPEAAPAVYVGDNEHYAGISLSHGLAQVKVHIEKYANDPLAYKENCTSDDGVFNNDSLMLQEGVDVKIARKSNGQLGLVYVAPGDVDVTN